MISWTLSYLVWIDLIPFYLVSIFPIHPHYNNVPIRWCKMCVITVKTTLCITRRGNSNRNRVNSSQTLSFTRSQEIVCTQATNLRIPRYMSIQNLAVKSCYVTRSMSLISTRVNKCMGPRGSNPLNTTFGPEKSTLNLPYLYFRSGPIFGCKMSGARQWDIL